MVKYLKEISRLILIQVIALAIMSLLRMVTFLAVPYELPSPITWGIVAKAFLIGVWFDNVIACYIMILPVAAVTILALFNYQNRRVAKIILAYIYVLFTVAFFIAIVNIPYFSYFFENLNASVYQWFAFLPTTMGMLLTEKSYWWYILLVIIFAWGWWRLLHIRYFTFDTRLNLSLRQKIAVAACGVCLLGAYAFGIRGRTGYNPIKISQAYFCNDPFINQLGISPTFNMIATTIDMSKRENRKLDLMAPDEAFAATRELLGLPESKRDYEARSLQRVVAAQPSIHGEKNVVVILMESMSANLLGKGDTPFLDSLSRESLYFEKAYSSGNHTNHGIYSTLYSLPAVMFRNMLKGSDVPHIDGMPQLFQKRGYATAFYMTHESQYDNMNAFLRTNGFDIIRSQEDFPKSEVVNSFGVPDNFILQYAAEELNGIAAEGKPFFSVILTISNHPPYVIPEELKENGIPEERLIVRYADRSLRNFFEKARRMPWFDNTIFVLLADHGKLLKEKECELPQSFNHIPLIIYGKDVAPETVSGFAQQIDVAPTLLGMMGWGYTQNNFGLDLTRTKREYAYYTGDKYLAIRSDDRLYLYRPSDGQEYFYIIDKNGMKKVKQAGPSFSKMKRELFSLIQSAEEFRRE